MSRHRIRKPPRPTDVTADSNPPTEEIAAVDEDAPEPEKPRHERYQPMYQGGSSPHDTTPIQKPVINPEAVHSGAAARSLGAPLADELEASRLGLTKPSGEQVVYRYGPVIMALVGVIVALVGLTLALWVSVDGCNCPMPQMITRTVPPPPPPDVPAP